MSDNQEETEHVWNCTLVVRGKLPEGADLPMREVLRMAVFHMTGSYPDAMFTNWGRKLSPIQLKIVRDRQNEKVSGNH